MPEDTLPRSVEIVIVGAGFAGAATAWALAREGRRSGLILEREAIPGKHASGKNAALVRHVEDDPVVRTLTRRGIEWLRRCDAEGRPLVRRCGSLLLASGEGADRLAEALPGYRAEGIEIELLPRVAARARFAVLDRIEFDAALWTPQDGVADIHALLTLLLDEAAESGFALRTECEVSELVVEGGRVRGVVTAEGEVRADWVVDASGAWAGRLGRTAHPLDLTPLRRHLFVSAPLEWIDSNWPYTWDLTAGYYFRPEGDGLLFCPCDEGPHAAAEPGVDPTAAELLAEKLLRRAPGLAEVELRRAWACLRTFAPDRRPVIGPDPELPGLFHVAGLGGFGMTAAPAVGEVAAALMMGRACDWFDSAAALPERLAGKVS